VPWADDIAVAESGWRAIDQSGGQEGGEVLQRVEARAETVQVPHHREHAWEPLQRVAHRTQVARRGAMRRRLGAQALEIAPAV
jgi:hypothetical protein